MLKMIVGWREWVSFPEIGIKKIKAKIDTGAKTSALHAKKIEYFTKDKKPWVRFTTFPLQQNSTEKRIQLPLIDERRVRSSNGHSDLRPIVQTEIKIGHFVYPIEFSLAGRDMMGFRFLLGREAMKILMVNPNASYLQSDGPHG